MTVSERRAFFVVGSRKAMTPLLTASTPVMAVQPLEKTRRSSQQARGGDVQAEAWAAR